MTVDECREDFRVLVGQRSTFAAACLGTVSQRGEPYESAIRTIARTSAWPGVDSADIVDDKVAGDRAVRYRVILPGGMLTEWKFAHRGWLFVAGVFCRTGDNEADALLRAALVCSTWQWIDDDRSSHLA
ncbi:MAG TPA: hypothetical protein VJ741_12780 [Solirubrobacteraceae bacterium]|nr:hypothetical protein [Solirubrobacteraceae bacterium]